MNAQTDILNDPLLIAAPENSFLKTDAEIKRKTKYEQTFERLQDSSILRLR
jgi:hypothetical protein